MSSHTINFYRSWRGKQKVALASLYLFLIGGAILVTIGIYAIAWCIDFVTAHWLWFAIPIGIIIVLIVIGCFVGDDKKENGNHEASKGVDNQQN